MEDKLAKEIFDDICTDNGVQIDSEKRDRIAVQFKDNIQIAEDMEFDSIRRSPNSKSDLEIITDLRRELKDTKAELESLKFQASREKFSPDEILSMRTEAEHIARIKF